MPEPITIPFDPLLAEEIRAVYGYYAALRPLLDPAHGLGGKLLFAGRLHPESVGLIRAANIAGAASLTVSDAQGELRQALRNGMVDFLVTSLDEALRILKNEVRKKLPVAVAVAASPDALLAEMVERGVQPDLLAAAEADIDLASARGVFLAHGAVAIEPLALSAAEPLRIWALPAVWTARSAELDARLLELLPAEEVAGRRWLRLSPRYLGRPAQKLRSAAVDEATALRFADLLSAGAGR